MACAECDKHETPFKCGKCKQVTYCSKACQKLHWTKHKFFCYPELVSMNTGLLSDIEELGIRAWSQNAVANSKQCSCETCAYECSLLPGVYSPFQILCDFEKKGPIIFDYMVQDYRIVKENVLFMYLRPAVVDEKAGQRSDLIHTGKCIHLGPNGCMLSRDAMPTGCVVALPCVTRGKMTQDKQNVHVMWTSSDGKKAMELFETHQRSKHKKVGSEDQHFLRSVRIHRIIADIMHIHSDPAMQEVAVQTELNLLGHVEQTKLEIEEAIKLVATCRLLAKA